MRPGTENPNKRRIRQAAFALMYERGFTATSYSDIAARAGVGRPLVQRHFPKKEQFVLDMIAQAAALCRQTLRAQDADCDSKTLRSLHFLQLYQELILINESMRNLTREVLASRDLTRVIIDTHRESTFVFFDDGASDVREATAKALGGIYELIVMCMDQGESLDANALAAQTMAAFLVYTTDSTYRDSLKAMEVGLLPAAQVRAWAWDICGELVG